jgi:fructose-specific phosphotransferase system IIC component/fructose-specific phosphotransferase system IIA component/fructose-specific phosphotransferase system IIB component
MRGALGMSKYDLIAATGCATGIAHTYMAQEALIKAARERGLTMKVETHGQSGVDEALTAEEIAGARAVIVAADIDVHPERFAGKPLVMVPVAAGIRQPNNLIDEALAPYAPIYLPTAGRAAATTDTVSVSPMRLAYTSLMSGVSHMLPLVVAGGVLIAISLLFGIYATNPDSSQYNAYAAMLNHIGKITMSLMVPVLSAYMAEAIAKRSGLIVGFAVGMIAQYNGIGFLGGIIGGYLAGLTVLGLQHLLNILPEREFRGLKSIFLYPVLGVLIAGSIMWLMSAPMASMNAALMTFLKSMQHADPVVLGVIVGVMCAADFGGPINKAAYLTGTALLASGNTLFMAGVSAACIAPPLATGIAVLLNRKAFTRDERGTGYVNFVLGATHITEGAIPFAAKNPLLNIPIFMVGSAVAAVLTYIGHIHVPAPHGGFIILPLVDHPLEWVVFILIGAAVSGGLLALSAEHSMRKHLTVTPAMDENTTAQIAAYTQETTTGLGENELGSILSMRSIVMDMPAQNRDDVLRQLAELAVQNGIANNAAAVYRKYQEREEQGPTGMIQGVAIPHAQDQMIARPAMLVARLAQPIPWPSLDDQPVDTIISFLVPDSGDTEHLTYLSNTAKLLTHQHFIKQLRAAKTPLQVMTLFRE